MRLVLSAYETAAEWHELSLAIQQSQDPALPLLHLLLCAIRPAKSDRVLRVSSHQLFRPGPYLFLS